MPGRFRLTRRFDAAITEDSRPRRRVEARLDEGVALPIVFETADSSLKAEAFGNRLRALKGDLNARKR